MPEDEDPDGEIDGEIDSDEQVGNPIDITEPKTFVVLALFCILAGSVMGMASAWLFYEVTHPVLWNGMRAPATQIPPFTGALIILVMAGTALLIALTFAYVPKWVIEYHKDGKIPEWIVKIYKKVSVWFHSATRRINGLEKR